MENENLELEVKLADPEPRPSRPSSRRNPMDNERDKWSHRELKLPVNVLENTSHYPLYTWEWWLVDRVRTRHRDLLVMGVGEAAAVDVDLTLHMHERAERGPIESSQCVGSGTRRAKRKEKLPRVRKAQYCDS